MVILKESKKFCGEFKQVRRVRLSIRRSWSKRRGKGSALAAKLRPRQF